MTKFADAVEINPSAMSSVSGGNRIIGLSQDATVGGIANVKGLEEMDVPVMEYGLANPNIYLAEVASGGSERISESQFDADVNQVYQSNNVNSDFTF